MLRDPCPGSCGGSAGRRLRGQSAVEFLSVYGAAITIIVIVAAIVFSFIALPALVIPQSCTMRGSVTCYSMIIGVNVATQQSTAVVVFVNSQPYPVSGLQFKVGFGGVNTTPESCQPELVGSGGSIVCSTSLSGNYVVGGRTSGTLYLSGTVCPEHTFGQLNCTGATAKFIATGDFNTHVDQGSAPSLSIALNALQTAEAAGGTPDALYANVMIGRIPLPGATVTYNAVYANGISATPPYRLAPSAAITNQSGTALSSIYGSAPGAVTVNANFGSYSANVQITFS